MTDATWDEREARLRRFYAAVHTDRLVNSANAAMRVADEEQAALVAEVADLRRKWARAWLAAAHENTLAIDGVRWVQADRITDALRTQP